MDRLKKLSGRAVLLAGLYIVVKWTLIIGVGTFLYRMGWWHNEFLLALPLIAVVVGLVYWRRTARSKRG